MTIIVLPPLPLHVPRQMNVQNKSTHVPLYRCVHVTKFSNVAFRAFVLCVNRVNHSLFKESISNLNPFESIFNSDKKNVHAGTCRGLETFDRLIRCQP